MERVKDPLPLLSEMDVEAFAIKVEATILSTYEESSCLSTKELKQEVLWWKEKLSRLKAQGLSYN